MSLLRLRNSSNLSFSSKATSTSGIGASLACPIGTLRSRSSSIIMLCIIIQVLIVL
ncbi:hypothetical protein Sjap_015122 [Stephania japonica]|uniref:Uncharacterized protein n=1 Tax=Stephania japonica TaxID=461633 RepID=A0AAP0IJB2_9MAGN